MSKPATLVHDFGMFNATKDNANPTALAKN
jgi:hypothetical protein